MFAPAFLASLDIAPVAPSHCQKLAKLADTEMSTVNQKDMDRIRTQTTLNNALLGLSGGREGEVRKEKKRERERRMGERKIVIGEEDRRGKEGKGRRERKREGEEEKRREFFF